jgi:hypothetical protein
MIWHKLNGLLLVTMLTGSFNACANGTEETFTVEPGGSRAMVEITRDEDTAEEILDDFKIEISLQNNVVTVELDKRSNRPTGAKSLVAA